MISVVVLWILSFLKPTRHISSSIFFFFRSNCLEVLSDSSSKTFTNPSEVTCRMSLSWEKLEVVNLQLSQIL